MNKSNELNITAPIESTIGQLKRIQASLWSAITDLSSNNEEINIFSSEIIQLKASWADIEHVIQNIVQKSENAHTEIEFNVTVINSTGDEVDCGEYSIPNFIKKVETDDTKSPRLGETLVSCRVPGLDITKESLNTVNSLYTYLKSLGVDRDGITSKQR